jgi:hypothetical protein
MRRPLQAVMFIRGNQLDEAVEAGFDGNLKEGPLTTTPFRAGNIERFSRRNPAGYLVQPSRTAELQQFFRGITYTFRAFIHVVEAVKRDRSS